MFSQTQEYALRAVVCLANHAADGPIGNAVIAEETSVPSSYLSKVMQSLAKADIVTSKRGAGGGFRLRRKPSELTVLEVINSVDPFRRITSCPLKLKSHRKTLCSMHSRLDESLALVEQTLGRSTIEEMMSAPGHPLPMVESPRQ